MGKPLDRLAHADRVDGLPDLRHGYGPPAVPEDPATCRHGVDALACTTPNYRKFMSGFTDWVRTVAGSEDAAGFRSRVTDPENASMGQSLAFKPSYKSGYCLAVCPAGEDVLGPYLDDRKAYLDTVLRPLQDKTETLYVLPGSEAQRYAGRRFPHKPTKEVSGGWRAPARRSADASGTQ